MRCIDCKGREIETTDYYQDRLFALGRSTDVVGQAATCKSCGRTWMSKPWRLPA